MYARNWKLHSVVTYRTKTQITCTFSTPNENLEWKIAWRPVISRQHSLTVGKPFEKSTSIWDINGSRLTSTRFPRFSPTFFSRLIQLSSSPCLSDTAQTTPTLTISTPLAYSAHIAAKLASRKQLVRVYLTTSLKRVLHMPLRTTLHSVRYALNKFCWQTFRPPVKRKETIFLYYEENERHKQLE